MSQQYEVGRELFWVGSDNRGTRYAVKIAKVWRKYLELSNRRKVHIDSLREVSEYGVPAQCWISKEAYESATARTEAWQLFQLNVRSRYKAPDHLSTEEIVSMIRCLNENGKAGGVL